MHGAKENIHHFFFSGKAVKKELPEELMQYYNQITKALVGGNTAVVKVDFC